MLACTSKAQLPVIEKSDFLTKHDLDGDGEKDQIWFDYSQGAHCCYQIHIELSASGKEIYYPFDMDGGYLMGVDDSQPNHFYIKDYDKDGRAEIFMSISTYNGRPSSIPESWTKQFGVMSNYILLDVVDDSIQIQNLPKTVSTDYYLKVKNGNIEKGIQPCGVENKSGYCDQNGVLVGTQYYQKASVFNNGRGLLIDEMSMTMIDEMGVIKYYSGQMFCIDTIFPDDGLLLIFDGAEGYYFIDKEGVVLNEKALEDAKGFSEGLAPIYDPKTDKWGYVNKQLEWVIDPFCLSAGNFKNGKAEVFISKKGPFVIDKKGRMEAWKE